MNCSETKPKLGFYFDQVLPDGEIQELINHLGACMSCSTELQNLKKIESVIQAGIYSEPPDEYWNDVPPRITKGIGIRPKVSAFEQFIESVGGILSAKSFRWGFAGAFAVALLIVTLNKVFVTQQAPVSITQSKSMENEQTPAASMSELNTIQNVTPLRPEKDLAINENDKLEIKEPLAKQLADLPDRNKGNQKIALNYINEALLALNSIAGKPLKTEGREVLGVNQELYPIPNTEFILPSQSDELQNENNPLQRTFALNKQGARSLKPDVVSELPDEIKRIRGGFLETLWIVQESQTLGEKKNIWLSYIDRESDITYRSLADYNLALVLAKIVEDSKDRNHATEARNFFLTHEEALRFQMGNERFDNKVSLFDKIVAN